ncbi:MAG: fibronectin type III domain-containing protein, partial [Phycisphaerales bacterium]|nr:fibronectin type III domain-containing protein [Phycisphaerales bacterium]
AAHTFTIVTVCQPKTGGTTVESIKPITVKAKTLKFPTPKKPSLIKSQLTSTSAAITWKATSLLKGITGTITYEVYRSETKGLKPGQPGWTKVATTTDLATTITNLQPDRTYYLYIRAIWSGATNIFSDSGVLTIKTK